MYVKQNFISQETMKLFLEGLSKIQGCVPENKLLIITPVDPEYKVGNLIIPGDTKELPRKGVVIQTGEITEEYRSYRDLVKPGKIVTYGLYAGKEIEFPMEIFPSELQPEWDKQKFTVLSLTEVVYSEEFI